MSNIAVLIPCYNEEATIAEVVRQFKEILPLANIYVYDNNSNDNTIEEARKAGALIGREENQGKGSVVRRMFCDIDADIYVLVDGDCTYDASAAPKLIETLQTERLAMLCATRVSQEKSAYRFGHAWGNKIFNKVLRGLFHCQMTDIFTGYRVFSRAFVKSFPKCSRGFEIETDLTIHTLELRLPVKEVPVPYFSRPEGSSSKLSSLRDGCKILWRMLILYKETQPFRFFFLFAFLFAGISLGLGYPVIREYFETGLVPRLPTAVLATGIMILSFLSSACALILDSVARGRREIKRLFYLQYT